MPEKNNASEVIEYKTETGTTISNDNIDPVEVLTKDTKTLPKKTEFRTKKISFEYKKNGSQAELKPKNQDDVNYMDTYAIIITVGGRKFTYRRSRID